MFVPLCFLLLSANGRPREQSDGALVAYGGPEKTARLLANVSSICHPSTGDAPVPVFSDRIPGKLVVVLRGEAFRAGSMLTGVTGRTANDSMTRQTNGPPEEQLLALEAVDHLLHKLSNATWKPSLFVDAVVKPANLSDLLRTRANQMLRTFEPQVAADDRTRIAAELQDANQIGGWLSTLHWIDGFADLSDADLLVMRIDLIAKASLISSLAFATRPSSVIFPFRGMNLNATDAMAFIPQRERERFAERLSRDAQFAIPADSEADSRGLHCLLGAYPGAAPLLEGKFDANSEKMVNPLYRLAGRTIPTREEQDRYLYTERLRQLRGATEGVVVP